LQAQRHGTQARAADLVDAEGGGRFGNARPDSRLPRGVLPGSGCQHLAQNDLVDIVGGNARALERRTDGNGAKIMRGHGAQRPQETADRRTGSAYNDDIAHAAFSSSDCITLGLAGAEGLVVFLPYYG